MNACSISAKRALRPGEHFRRTHAGLFLGRQAAGEDRLGDERGRHAQVERVLAHPLAGPLLLRRVENLVDETLARVGILHAEDVARDFDQIAFQLGAVPGVEDVVQFVVAEPERLLEQEIRLADELHVAVFDAVVDHLDVMARARLRRSIRSTECPPSARPWRRWPERSVLICGQAALVPPGMMLGPLSAPSSPPETPVPTYSSPLASASLMRRSVSAKCVLPPSIMMSPRLKCGTSSPNQLVDGRAGLDHHHDLARRA